MRGLGGCSACHKLPRHFAAKAAVLGVMPHKCGKTPPLAYHAAQARLNTVRSLGGRLGRCEVNEMLQEPISATTSSKRTEAIFMIGLMPIVTGLLSAFILLMFWRWFVKPLGVPDLNFWHSYGLIVIISFIRYDNKRPVEPAMNVPDKELLTHLRRQYEPLAIFFFIGWLAHLLMGKG